MAARHAPQAGPPCGACCSQLTPRCGPDPQCSGLRPWHSSGSLRRSPTGPPGRACPGAPPVTQQLGPVPALAPALTPPPALPNVLLLLESLPLCPAVRPQMLVSPGLVPDPRPRHSNVLCRGMLPCLGSAMCACTWHLFYNSPDLEVRAAAPTIVHGCRQRWGVATACAVERAQQGLRLLPQPSSAHRCTRRLPRPQFLVALQAALTVLGNCTCAWAAYRIWRAAAMEQAP